MKTSPDALKQVHIFADVLTENDVLAYQRTFRIPYGTFYC